MSQTGLTQFDCTILTTNTWLKELMERMGWLDRASAYRALRAVLHALRDQLTVDEVVTLGAQFPMLIRGFYYEGWHPAGKPLKERKKGLFLAHIAEAFRDSPDVDPEEVARQVFQLLAKHVTAGEIEGVKHCLPTELRALWPRAGDPMPDGASGPATCVKGKGRPGTSVAEAFCKAHAALLEDLGKLEEAARADSGEGLAKLRTRLDVTRAHVTEHFRFEEQNGYMDAVRKREPRLERTIQQLAAEHRQVAESLEQLVEQAAVATSLTDPFREEIRGWVDRVRQHEARENDVVQDAFYQDISAED
ncbi:MAG TPA: DUF2267 domain-containing protein [Gemmataceae bacterium]|nr:DUF2267 domain-containing protein [Gemmataceae bacterium]